MELFFLDWLNNSKNLMIRYFLIAGISYLIFYIIFKNHFIQKKIQNRFLNWGRIKNEILNSLVTILIFAAIATLVIKYLFSYTNLYSNTTDYSKLYYIMTFPIMIVIHDTYFYWSHRLMHHPKLFKHVHLVHHKSTNPSPWSSYSFHPLEALIEAGIIPLIAFTIPVHKSPLIFFLAFQFIYNVYGHLGFELYPKNFHKTYIGKWVNTSVAHNLHNRFFNKNYGLYFLFWDRITGTIDKNYDKKFEKITGK